MADAFLGFLKILARVYQALLPVLAAFFKMRRCKAGDLFKLLPFHEWCITEFSF